MICEDPELPFLQRSLVKYSGRACFRRGRVSGSPFSREWPREDLHELELMRAEDVGKLDDRRLRFLPVARDSTDVFFFSPNV